MIAQYCSALKDCIKLVDLIFKATKIISNELVKKRTNSEICFFLNEPYHVFCNLERIKSIHIRHSNDRVTTWCNDLLTNI